MEDIIIEFHIPKEQAIKIAKKAIGKQIAIQKDDGDYFEAGVKKVPFNPGMLVTIKVNDDHYALNKKGLGNQLVDQAAFLIKEALEEAGSATQSSAPAAGASSTEVPKSKVITDPDKYLAYQERVVHLLKLYKELLSEEIINEEEFVAKKEELLNFPHGMAKK